MKLTAYSAFKAGDQLQVVDIECPKPGADQVVVAITHCGVCRSDWHFLQNSWGDSQYPIVPGHEIVGQIIACGEHVARAQLGQRVGVSWQVGACWHCEWCKQGREELCAHLNGIGIGAQGGFADHIVVDQRFIYPLPKQLNSAEAAPLLCAGATAYNALTRFNIKAGMRVAILGIGGIGHLAVQFAHKMGCEVTALVHHLERAAEIKQMGASQVILSDDSQQLSALTGQFDFVLSTIDSDIDYQPYIDLLRPLGAFCFIGIPVKPIAISVFSLIIGQKIIGAVPLGSHETISEMLEFAATHGVKPQIELLPMTKVNQALTQMVNGHAHYRIVLFNENT